MLKFAKATLLGTAAAALFAHGASAADIIEAPVVEAPAPVVVEEAPAGSSGWYLRGDIDYHWSEADDISYITYGPPPGTGAFTTTEIDGSWSIGAGIGYRLNDYLRTDLTVDYLTGADFTGSTSGFCGGVACTSFDTSSYSALLVLANAYVDLGTYHGFTPYIGAGIGGAHVNWDDLINDDGTNVTTHRGNSNMRFAYALMAGTSYCVTDNVDLDVGYRYTHIDGGRMFDYADSIPTDAFGGTGPGYDDGIDLHEVRAGLRYSFGGARKGCGGGGVETVAYEPAPTPDFSQPVYKP